MTKNATYCDKHVSSRKCIFFAVMSFTITFFPFIIFHLWFPFYMFVMARLCGVLCLTVWIANLVFCQILASSPLLQRQWPSHLAPHRNLPVLCHVAKPLKCKFSKLIPNFLGRRRTQRHISYAKTESVDSHEKTTKQQKIRVQLQLCIKLFISLRCLRFKLEENLLPLPCDYKIPSLFFDLDSLWTCYIM